MLQSIIVIALIVMGYCCVFWEGMILHKVREWAEDRFPDWVTMPLGGCYICTVPWIGLPVSLVLFHPGEITWAMRGLMLLGAMGFNAALSKLFVEDGRTTLTINDREVDMEPGSFEEELDYNGEPFKVPRKDLNGNSKIWPNE